MALLRRMEANIVGCDDQLVHLRSVPCEMRPENIFQMYDEQRLVVYKGPRIAYQDWLHRAEHGEQPLAIELPLPSIAVLRFHALLLGQVVAARRALKEQLLHLRHVVDLPKS